MIESGLDVRRDKRKLISKQIKSMMTYHDDKIDVPISFDFIQKILIWMSACLSACTFIFFVESYANYMKL